MIELKNVHITEVLSDFTQNLRPNKNETKLLQQII